MSGFQQRPDDRQDERILNLGSVVVGLVGRILCIQRVDPSPSAHAALCRESRGSAACLSSGMVAHGSSRSPARPPEAPVKWLADECFDNDIIRGLLRRSPGLDLIRAQDVSEIAGRDDEKLLAWATMIPALLLQHQHAFGCTPVVLVPDSLPIGQVIEEILLLDRCSLESDWAAGVIHLPLH